MTPLRLWLAATFLAGALSAGTDEPALARSRTIHRITDAGAVPAASGAPSYSAAAMVATCNGAQGPFAPNMEVTMYGAGLANSTYALAQADIAGGEIPTTLNGVRVLVDGYPAPLFYVSDSQVNFLIPANEIAGQATVSLVRESVTGPQIQITLVSAAPALFPSVSSPGYAIAQLWPAYTLIEPNTPAPSTGIVILYAEGLAPPITSLWISSRIPELSGRLTDMKDFNVYLNGKPLDSSLVLYAGICPGWAGLYQVDLFLPNDVGTDPEIRVGIGQRLSPAGLKLAVR